MKILYVCLLSILLYNTGHTHNLSNVMKKVLPSIVYISSDNFTTISEINPTTYIVEEKKIELSPIVGTGFIINDNIIVTNYHVIEHAQKQNTSITVSFINHNKYYRATIIGYDKIVDVALLQIQDTHPSVKIAKCNNLNMGDSVFTISHFYGIGWSATNGIISSTQRENLRYPYIKNLQLQILSGTGSSGGPVFNEDGDVVGLNRNIITMSKYSAEESQLSMAAFPVRCDSLYQSINYIKAFSVVDRVDLGRYLFYFGKNSAYHVNENINFHTGIMVGAKDNTNIDSKLLTGDIITSVDNIAFDNPGILLTYLNRKYKVNDIINLHVYRDGKLININVPLLSTGSQ